MRACTHMLSHPGLKCGVGAVDLESTETVLESELFSRIIRWRNSAAGGHPWQVSITKALIS